MTANVLLKACRDADYINLMREMKDRDFKRIGMMKSRSTELFDFKPFIYSTEPLEKIVYERLWLEPRVGYYTPIKYYQDLYINNEKQSMFWRHDCLRGIYHDKMTNTLWLFEKHVTEDEKQFLAYIYLKLDANEFQIKKNNMTTVSTDIDKEVTDLLTGQKKTIHVLFNFIHHPIRHVSPIHAKSTALYRSTYKGGKSGRIQARSNISRYVIPSSHLTAHPYLLNLHKKYGYEEPEDMEKEVNEYIDELL